MAITDNANATRKLKLSRVAIGAVNFKKTQQK
jgi:hypothetical protein